MGKLIPAALVLAFAALGASRAEAYSHGLISQAHTKVHVRIVYVLCSSDTFDLKPGQVVTYRSGACCIERVQFYNQSNFMSDGTPRRWEQEFGMLCKNTNIVIQETSAGLLR